MIIIIIYGCIHCARRQWVPGGDKSWHSFFSSEFYAPTKIIILLYYNGTISGFVARGLGLLGSPCWCCRQTSFAIKTAIYGKRYMRGTRRRVICLLYIGTDYRHPHVDSWSSAMSLWCTSVQHQQWNFNFSHSDCLHHRRRTGVYRN